MNISPRPALLGLMLLLVIAVFAGWISPTVSTASADGLVLVRIRAATSAEGLRLAHLGLDLMEARDGDDLFAIVTPTQQQMLLDAGWDVRINPEQPASLTQSAALQATVAGYRSVDDTNAWLKAQAEAFPNLTTLVDIGDSWEKITPDGAAGDDLWALRITNKAISGDKPIFFLMAAIHARELTTSELATRFIDWLLQGYGHNADITWLLDEHEIVVLPIANPDGRRIAEQGISQRKNTNHTHGPANCGTSVENWQIGVDLNRNFGFEWGTINSPVGTLPCELTYPGPTAVSEPETQALQAFMQSLFTGRSAPTDDNPAPRDSTGLMITLHSFSDLVLWPWGFTEIPAPNSEELARLGKRLASFNGYTPSQSIGLYPTSGTTDDWSYGTLGVASFTFEVGPDWGECAFFMPPASCLDGGVGGNFWGRNLPAFVYAARVARAPYTQPFGPEFSNIYATWRGDTLYIRAKVAVNTAVTSADLFLGQSPSRGGVGRPFAANDGKFDAPTEEIYVSVPAADLAGVPYLLMQATNVDGLRGPIFALNIPEQRGYTLALPLLIR